MKYAISSLKYDVNHTAPTWKYTVLMNWFFFLNSGYDFFKKLWKSNNSVLPKYRGTLSNPATVL